MSGFEGTNPEADDNRLHDSASPAGPEADDEVARNIAASGEYGSPTEAYGRDWVRVRSAQMLSISPDLLWADVGDAPLSSPVHRTKSPAPDSDTGHTSSASREEEAASHARDSRDEERQVADTDTEPESGADLSVRGNTEVVEAAEDEVIETGRLLPPLPHSFAEATSFMEPEQPDEPEEAEWQRRDELEPFSLSTLIEDMFESHQADVSQVAVLSSKGEARVDDMWTLDHQLPSGETLRLALSIRGEGKTFPSHVLHIAKMEPSDDPSRGRRMLSAHEYSEDWEGFVNRTDYREGHDWLKATTITDSTMAVDYSQMRPSSRGIGYLFGSLEDYESIRFGVSHVEFDGLQTFVGRLDALHGSPPQAPTN